MKVVFIGNFEVDYSSENHYKKTLEKLSCTVIPIQENKTDFTQIMRELKEADMLFHVHTHGWHIGGLRQIYDYCRLVGIPTVGYHLDLWLGLEREKDIDTDPYWHIQYFFTVDKLMADFLNAREDMPKAYFLPAGVFEDECYLAKPDREKYPHDVIFVGSRNYHPEWQYRGKLIECLEKNYKERFAQYGGGGLGTVRGHELNTLYASAKIVIGDTLCKGFDYPYYLSDRIFETIGRGGFLIHPYIEGLNDLFAESELVTYEFNHFEQLREKIDYFLENETEREKIKKAGHERVKKEHTYTQRLQYILDTVL